jgi:hypothetical protein
MVPKTEGEMKKGELAGEDVRDRESGIKVEKRGVDQQTGRQKTKIVIAMWIESGKGEEIAIEREAVITEAAEESVREVEARTDTELRRVSFKRLQNMAIA